MIFFGENCRFEFFWRSVKRRHATVQSKVWSGESFSFIKTINWVFVLKTRRRMMSRMSHLAGDSIDIFRMK